MDSGYFAQCNETYSKIQFVNSANILTLEADIVRYILLCIVAN